MKESHKHPTPPSSKEGSKKPSKEESKQKKSKEEILKEQNKELTDHLQRLQAEFENSKKRAEKEKEGAIIKEKHTLLLRFLPFLDSFEEALKAHPDEIPEIQLLYKQIKLIFEELGITSIEAKGKHFNLHYHDAVLQQPSDKEPNTIIEEIQKGYLHHNIVLRHSKVIVAKPQEPTE
ncbi:nucleotide exchange factor GrpE [Candidatus Woesearchaeota archaeon]|nr:nucleotide exchange factor GrpE [Candidatus Woesearchaeota archaeon]